MRVNFEDEKWMQLAQDRIPWPTSSISCKTYLFSINTLQVSQLLGYYEVSSIKDNEACSICHKGGKKGE
jgi:hypothetical protein